MRFSIALLLAACSSTSATDDGGADASGSDVLTTNDGSTKDVVTSGDASAPIGLASKYPGDQGIDKDPAVVWVENFEEGSVGAVTTRYDTAANPPGMSLVADIPGKSGGKASMKLTSSGDGANATDLYKSFKPGYSEWYVRWYAKYQTGNIEWHHVGMWFGGYNPSTPYPNPQAGLKPNGDDRFAIALEPSEDIGTGAARLDFYNYWMQMHSWMAQPSGNTAYYGNAVVHQSSFKVDEGQWICVEVHAKMNTDLASGTGGVLELWKNDALVVSFDDQGPKGYWIRDKFCLPNGDGTECTAYPAPFDTVMNLQWRSVSALDLNYFWPQNYITQAGITGDLQLDDMVIATSRIGCLQ